MLAVEFEKSSKLKTVLATILQIREVEKMRTALAAAAMACVVWR